MKKIFFVLIITSFIAKVSSAAIYNTPGTGVNWNLDDLVANSGGFLTAQPGYYQVNDTIRISTNDVLTITTDATVKFAANTSFIINGRVLIDPPTSVLFTALNSVNGFLGMRLDNSIGSIIRKLTLEYAVSLNLTDSSPLVDSCTFQFNNNLASTTFGNGAIALFRSKATITNSSFLNNKRAAIQGGSNINNAPKIINCLFLGNNTSNANVPQINLGATATAGEDTVRILNNQILRASTNSGGIGFLPIGNVYAVITGNVIKNNRYGITLNGGSNINSIISYNQVDSNNTQNNPSLGGSGIAFSGGSTTSHQNSIVTNNLFRWNLWGITIQGGSKPNLGDLSNLSADDDGYNVFTDNTNTTTPGIDLYNNSPDNIMAQNNYWGSDNPADIENKIFHQPDNATLGLVNYSAFIPLPVVLLRFGAVLNNQSVQLSWQTSAEQNTAYFELEKSLNGSDFYMISRINCFGLSTGANYNNADQVNTDTEKYFYRLKIVEKDGSYTYSGILRVLVKARKNEVMVFPTDLAGTNLVSINMQSSTAQDIKINLVDASGKMLFSQVIKVSVGSSIQKISLPLNLPKALLFMKVQGATIRQTIPLNNF